MRYAPPPRRALENPAGATQITTMRTYRTFDKLIATIRVRRSAERIRTPFGIALHVID